MVNNKLLMLNQARDLNRLSQFSNVLIWGAGNYIEPVLSYFGTGAVSAVYDNDPQKWGKYITGVPVCPPEKFSADKNTAVVISAVKCMDDIAKDLHTKYHVSSEQLFPLVTENTAKYHYHPDLICAHQSELEQVWELLADNESKQYFAGYVNAVLTMDPLYLVRNPCIIGAYIYQNQKETIAPMAGDCIVDCGAFIGDTMERFVQLSNNNCKFYGLEPVSGNYSVLMQTIKKYPSVFSAAIQCAVGKELGTAEITSDSEVTVKADVFGTYSEGINAVKETVPVETIDHLFTEQIVDYIKMDIEGEEVSALLGAQRIIQRDRPSMMLSAYHMINHMWEIPLLIHNLDPAYRIYCGHQPMAAFEPEFYCIAR